MTAWLVGYSFHFSAYLSEETPLSWLLKVALWLGCSVSPKAPWWCWWEVDPVRGPPVLGRCC